MSTTILASLTRIGNILSNAIKRQVPISRVPSNIADAVEVKQPRMLSLDRGYIDVIIDVKKAPAARAFEWGSGIHAERRVSNRGTYIIFSKKGNLRIPESNWPGFEWPLKTGPKMVGFSSNKFTLRYVDHPGVESRPYIQPAIESAIPELRRIAAKAIKIQVLNSFKALGEQFEIGVSSIEVK